MKKKLIILSATAALLASSVGALTTGPSGNGYTCVNYGYKMTKCYW